MMDMKLEVVVLPVSDVDRAKHFYEKLGFRLDIDLVVSEDFRVVQFTPPGSKASIHIGKGITPAAPGSLQNVYLVVFDIEEARADLVSRGIDESEVSTAPGGRCQARIRNVAHTSRTPPSVIRTATPGCCRKSRNGFLAGPQVNSSMLR